VDLCERCGEESRLHRSVASTLYELHCAAVAAAAE
jgi:hypothetical protein